MNTAYTGRRTLKIFSLALTIAGLLLTAPAYAGSVGYLVGGWAQQFPGPIAPPADAPWGPNGYPGDTVSLQGYFGILDLTPGTYFLPVNTVAWTIDYTYGGTATDPNQWSDVTSNFTAATSMVIGGAGPVAISQTGNLLSTWDNDFLGFATGSAVSFDVQGYRVDVTPLGLSPVGGSNFSGNNPWVQPDLVLMAKFDVTNATVPDASSTVALLGAALLGLAALRRKFSRA